MHNDFKEYLKSFLLTTNDIIDNYLEYITSLNYGISDMLIYTNITYYIDNSLLFYANL